MDFKFSSTHPLFGKRLLSLDYGSKVIGLASFHVGFDPFPVGCGRIIVEQTNWKNELKKIIENESIDQLIIGVPYLLDGKATSTTERNLNVCSELKTLLDIPVLIQDETLTTFEAEDRMKNSPLYNFKVDPKKIDEVSAVIILEDFLKLTAK